LKHCQPAELHKPFIERRLQETSEPGEATASRATRTEFAEQAQERRLCRVLTAQLQHAAQAHLNAVLHPARGHLPIG